MERSIAVLYFENLSGVKEDEYFRDGITEDIITELSKIKGLKIFSRPTVLAYRDKTVTPAQIGQQLGHATGCGDAILRRLGLRFLEQCLDDALRSGVRLELGDVQAAVGEVHLEVGSEGDHAYVLCADTGLGIPPEVLPRIFDLFVQEPRGLALNSGLGIGLSICRSICAASACRVSTSDSADCRKMLPVLAAQAGQAWHCYVSAVEHPSVLSGGRFYRETTTQIPATADGVADLRYTYDQGSAYLNLSADDSHLGLPARYG